MPDNLLRTRQLLDADWGRLMREMGRDDTQRPWHAVFSPRFAPVALLRTACGLERRGWRVPAKLMALLDYFLFGIEFSTRAEIGPGLIIPHTQGIVLGARRIGRNVTIYQQVTLGARDADYHYDPATRPVIEDGVTLTAGVKVIGPVTVGAGALIGANGVVVRDIPPGVVAVGVPAKPLERGEGRAANEGEAAAEHLTAIG